MTFHGIYYHICIVLWDVDAIEAVSYFTFDIGASLQELASSF